MIDSNPHSRWLTAPRLANGRDRDRRDPEAHQPEVVVDVRAAARVGNARRAHVVEEASPLVVDDEQRAALPVRRLDEGVHHVGHERLPEPHVTERMLVRRHAVAASAVAERRVDERDVRQRARRAVGVVLGHRPCPRDAARSPDRRERQVGVVVAGGLARARSRGRTPSPTGCRACRPAGCCRACRPTAPTTCSSGSATSGPSASSGTGRRS